MSGFIKKIYKSCVPRLANSFGAYDININNTQHKYFVPMYHRIIQDAFNDPYSMGMCVTEYVFEKQLKYFSDNFISISLSEYNLNRHKIENNRKNYITLTFDDGYADNLEVAHPIIKKYNLDCSIFICTKIFNDKSNYWWDSLINAFKASKIQQLDLTDLNVTCLNKKYNVLTSGFNDVRELLYAVWSNDLYKDKVLLDEIVLRLLNGEQEPLVGHLTEEQVIKLYKNGVDIGAHSVTHPDLTSLSLKEAKYEIEKSKSILKDLLGVEIRGFAYPAGFKNEEVVGLVKDLKFEYAVATDAGVNYSYNKFEIQRIGMPQTNLSDLKRCLSNYSKYQK